MILSFKDRGTRDIFNGVQSKAARRTLPTRLHEKAAERMDWLDVAPSLRTLTLPGLRLEALRGERKGQHSIRVNDQFRICFRWTKDGPVDVEVVDYH